MTVKFASLKVDLKREADGDWVDIPELPGVRLRVRSLQTPAYQVAADLLRQKHQRKYASQRVPPEVWSRDFGGLLAEHILLDWQGFDVPYADELARETLCNPEYRELAGHVLWAGSTLGAAEIEFVEQAAKNSGQPSATS